MFSWLAVDVAPAQGIIINYILLSWEANTMATSIIGLISPRDKLGSIKARKPDKKRVYDAEPS
jgi:hypothetical protein